MMNPNIPRHNSFSAMFPLVTPNMVRSRTVELAILAGRRCSEIRQSDYERAKRELTGETDFDRQQAVLYPALQFTAVRDHLIG